MEFCTANGRLQPGFRFYPTDEELIMYYLKRKVLGKRLEPAVVSEVDIYQFHPQDLREIASLKKDRNWYFFCPRGKKYGCGDRTNRATNTGYWKATGNDRPVTYQDRTVGKIKTLIFHQGKPPKGDRTDWVMHEFKLDDKKLSDVSQDSYVLCKIFKKSGWGPKNGEQYGAPFMEEEWNDDDDDDEVPQMVHAAESDGVQNQSISSVTNVMECTHACPEYTSEQVYSGSVSTISAVDQAPPPPPPPAYNASAAIVSSSDVLIPNYTTRAIDQAPMSIASDWTSCPMPMPGVVSVYDAPTSNEVASAANLASTSQGLIPYYNAAEIQATPAMPVHASYWASTSNVAFPNYYDPAIQIPTTAMPMPMPVVAADIASTTSMGPLQFYDDDEIFTADDLGDIFRGLDDLDNGVVQANDSAAWGNFYEGGLAISDLDESL